MGRELGVATSECTVCGSVLHQVAQADGSVAVGACSSCHPSPELASQAQSISRELGVPEAQAPDFDSDRNAAVEDEYETYANKSTTEGTDHE